MDRSSITFNSQANQDEFVLWCLDYKRNGTFVELGSNDAVQSNNSYVLEKEFGWRGLMVEYESRYLPSYKEHRPNSMYMIADGADIDYCEAFDWVALPRTIDYLQIDFDAENGSTLLALEAIEQTMDAGYTFNVVTFEHDIYTGDHHNTRAASRAIFEKHGYVRLFSDVCHVDRPFEDWYIHSSLCAEEVWRPLCSDQVEPSTAIMERLYATRASMMLPPSPSKASPLEH
jgi:hypothetical protein